jgi:hypothetical protein
MIISAALASNERSCANALSSAVVTDSRSVFQVGRLFDRQQFANGSACEAAPYFHLDAGFSKLLKRIKFPSRCLISEC